MNSDIISVNYRNQIPRWMSASVMQYIQTIIERINTGKITMMKEAQVTADNIRLHPELFIVSFNGPDIKPMKKIQRYELTYTIVVSTHRQNNDIHAHERTLGVALECFPVCMPIFRYGDGSTDDQQQMGTMQQITDPNTFGHGASANDTPVYQSSISAQYRMDFEEQ